MSYSDHQNPACQGEIGGGFWEAGHQLVRKPAFCKRMRPRAPLARMIGARSRSGSPEVRDGGLLVKIGAKVVMHARYVVFQMAEVAIPRRLFAVIPRRISRLCPVPV